MHFPLSVGVPDNSLYCVGCIYFVFIHIILAYDGLARVPFLRFDLFWRRRLVVPVLSDWAIGLARLVRVNLFMLVPSPPWTSDYSCEGAQCSFLSGVG